MNGIISILAVAVVFLLVAVIGLAYWLLQIHEEQKYFANRIDDLETEMKDANTKIETMPKTFRIAKEDEIARIKTFVFKLIPESINDLWEEIKPDDRPDIDGNLLP